MSPSGAGPTSEEGVWLLIVLFVTLVVAAHVFAPRVIAAVRLRALDGNEFSTMYRLGNVLRRLPGTAYPVIGEWLRTTAAVNDGSTDTAVDGARRFLALLEKNQNRCPWFFVNAAIAAFVNAGLYTEAEAVARRWPKEARRKGRRQDRVSYQLSQVNRAEALHNLGDTDKALRILRRVLGAAMVSPYVEKAALCTQAWILVHTGRVSQAAEAIAEVEPGAFGPRYESEVYMTRAAIARELGALGEATLHAKAGLDAARRASSKRNALVLLGSIECARGNWEDAVRILTEATSLPYRAQGAMGFIKLGEAWEALGEPRRAEEAFRLAVETDPESSAARALRGRLTAC